MVIYNLTIKVAQKSLNELYTYNNVVLFNIINIRGQMVVYRQFRAQHYNSTVFCRLHQNVITLQMYIQCNYNVIVPSVPLQSVCFFIGSVIVIGLVNCILLIRFLRYFRVYVTYFILCLMLYLAFMNKYLKPSLNRLS